MVVILYSDALMIISIWMPFAVTVEKVLLKTFLAIWLFALHFPKLDGDYCYTHLHSLPFCLGNSKFKAKKNIWTVIYFALPFNVFVNLNFAIFFPSFCHLFREILDTVMNIDYYSFIQTSSIQFGGVRIFLPPGSIKTRKIDKLHKDIWTIASLHVYNLFNIYHSQKESTHFGLKITALYRVLAHFEPKIDKDFLTISRLRA